MYARVVKVVLGPDTQWEVEHIVDLFCAILKPYKGFEGITLLADYENGEYESISWWETEEDLLDTMKLVRPKLEQILCGKFQWGPAYQVFQVYKPNL